MHTLRRAGTLALVLLAVVVLVTTVHAVVESRSPLPVRDQWAAVADTEALARGELGVTALFRQHNEHRITVPRLVLLADSAWCAQSGVLAITVTFLLQALHALLLLRLVRTGAPRAGPATPAIGALLATAAFAGIQWENFVEPFQVQFALVFLAATAAFAALARAARPPHGRWLWLSIAAAVVATLSMGNGVVIWLLLPVAGLALQLPRRALWTLGIVGLLVVVPYAATYARPGPADPTDAALDPRSLLQFFAAMLGGALRLPDILPRPSLAATVGGALLALFVAAAVRRQPGVASRGQWPPADVALLGVGVFAIAAAAVTAAARIHLGVHSALASRYATPALWFTVATVALALRSPRRWLRHAGVAAAILATLAVVLEQRAALEQMRRDRTFVGPAISSLWNGVADPTRTDHALGMMKYDQIGRLVGFLREQRRSVFRAAADRVVGSKLRDVVGDATPVAWVGTVDVAAVAGTGWGMRVHGIVDLPATALEPTGVIADGDRIAGVCLVTARTDDPDTGAAVVDGHAAVATTTGELRVLLHERDGGWRALPAAAFRTVELALSAGTPLTDVGTEFAGDFALLGDQPEARLVPRDHAQIGLSTTRGTGSVRIGPIAGDGALGVPVLTGPATFGLRLALVEDGTGAVVTAMQPAPTFGAWRIWRAEIPRKFAGRRLSLLATDSGDYDGQWLAVAMPGWLPAGAR
jgi:hypothetical protein